MTNVFETFSRRFPAGDAFIKRPTGEVVYTYDDLDRLTAAFASYFTTRGLTRGDRVIVQVEKSAECLIVYFACLRAGLIYLPLNTAYQRREIEYFVDNAEPSMIICDPASAGLYRSLTDCAVETLDANGRGSLYDAVPDATFDTVSCAPDDVAVILYTSGTTGQPKGAMITHRNLESNALALYDAWDWQTSDTMLHALPVFHIHGLFVATHLAVLGSCPLIFLSAFDPDTVIRALPQSTVYMGVPTNYVRLLANPGMNDDVCRNMRLFTSGSAPLLVQTFEAFRSRTGHTIVERYGMTETGMNTSNPLDGPRKPGTVGLPLPGVSARIVDDAGRPVESGTTGNLLIKGENVFKGYWRMPDKTREEFDGAGYFKTGDLAQRDEDGYISIVGRSKDLIISGGLNVYPKEIEAIIDDLPGVVESAVIGVPHADFGEAVTAVVVRDEDADVDEQAIIDHLKSVVANFKVAKRVHFVDALPRNAMGKVQKNRLREDFGKTWT